MIKYTILSCESSFGTVWYDTNEHNVDIKWAFRGNKLWISKGLSNLGDVNIIL